jgi:hypothetical protein
MKIVILVVAVCLAVVLGGQLYYLVNIEHADGPNAAVVSISGRLDCGAVAGCCDDGVKLFLDYSPQAGGAPDTASVAQTACGGFFRFDRVAPGRHFLYGQFRPGPGASLVTVELASVKAAPGEHQALGTVSLRR